MSALYQEDTLTEIKIKEPSMYNVILHNDDQTTFDFVINVLQQVFNKEFQDALMLAQDVHEKGMRVVETYTKEVATEKVNETTMYARAYGFPLLVTAEEA